MSGTAIQLWSDALAPLLLFWSGAPAAVAASSLTNEGGNIQVFETPGSSASLRAADQHLAQQIQARLEADPWVLSYKLQASVRGGVATLSGYVDNLLAQARAAQVAQTVPGVRAVSNQLQLVVPPRSDPMLHDEVQGFLLRHRPLEHANIQVAVQGGEVILSGSVDSAYRKQLAQAVAQSVSGVRGMENKLRVDHLASRSDQDIELDVESRIEWDPGLVDPQVSVTVQAGVVHLAGMVMNRPGRDRVVQDAQVAGVKAVDIGELYVWQKPPVIIQGDGAATGAASAP